MSIQEIIDNFKRDYPVSAGNEATKGFLLLLKKELSKDTEIIKKLDECLNNGSYSYFTMVQNARILVGQLITEARGK